MGIIWGLLGYSDSGRTDDPDPATGLTSRDKFLVKKTWAIVMKNPVDSGVALLLLYFKKYPHAKQLFEFKDIPNEELTENAKFRAHCSRVIYAVASVVDSIDNLETLVNLLEKIGSSHKPRNVSEQLFLELKDTMLDLFSSLFKQNEVEAWKKTADVVFIVIIGGLKSS